MLRQYFIGHVSMFANSVLTLAVVGVLGNFFPKHKLTKLFPLLSVFILGMVLYVLFDEYSHNHIQKISIPWLDYMNLRVQLSLFSSVAIFQQLLPILLISISSVLISCFNQEQKKQSYSSLLLWNVCIYITLICATNLLQVLIASCLMTLLGFCIIDDIDARKKYAFYNLLADLSLFTVCSLFYGYVGVLEISQLSMYDNLGAHRDLVGILLVFAIALKSGLFPFHNQLYDLSVLNFNRLNYLLFASAPLAAIVLLYKFMPLLNISAYSLPILKFIIVAHFLCGFFNALVLNDIKEKNVALAQMLYAFAVEMLVIYHIQPETLIPFFIFCGYVFSLMLYAVYDASSYELSVHKMGGFITHLKLLFLFLSFAFFALLSDILSLTAHQATVSGIFYTIILTLSFAHVMRQIFFGQTKADEDVFARLRFPSWYIAFSLLLVGACVFKYTFCYSYICLGLLILYIAIILFNPFKFLEKLYDNETVQESDIFEKVFDVLILTPLIILGRILWLLVDFILIERTLINSLSNATGFLIKLGHGVNKFSMWQYFVYLFIAVLMLVFCVYVKG